MPPDDNVDPELKMEPWFFKQMAEYIYGLYVCNYGSIPYDDNNFSELRAYAAGHQSKGRYMSIIDPSMNEGKGTSEQGFININWDIVQILPKMLDIVKGKFMEIDFDISTKAIDADAHNERSKMYRRMMLETLPQWQALQQQTGMRASDEVEMQGLQSPDDVKMFFELGGFKLAYEILAKDVIDISDAESNWMTVKDMVIFDLLTLANACFQTYVEEATGIVKFKYIDPDKFVARSSMYPDNRDMDFAGHIEDMTISEIRMQSDLSEAELAHIAKMYSKQPGNNLYGRTAFYDTEAREQYYNRHGRFPIDDYKITVMNIEFISADAEKYVYGFHKNGNYIFDKVGYDSELNNRDVKRGKKMHKQDVQWVYSCKWIVGTDYVFQTEKTDKVVRKGQPGNKKACLSYQYYNIDGPGMVERCKAYVDDIQLSTLKLRNLKVKLPPAPQLAVDISSMQESVNLGGQVFNITDLIDIFGRTGILIYKSVNEWGMAGAANRPPIQEISINAMNSYNMYQQDIAFGIGQLRAVLGLNEISDGSNLQRDVLKSVAEGVQQATNYAQRPYLRGYQVMRTMGADYCVRKWQMVVLSGGANTIKYLPIHERSVKMIKISKDLSNYEFGIYVSLRPTEQEKQLLLQHIMQLRQQRTTTGSGGLNEADFFVVSEMIREGDLKKAQLFLTISTRRQQMQDIQERQMMMEQQKNVQIETAQASTKAEMEKIQMEHALKMQEAQMKHQFDIELQDKKKNDQIEILVAQAQAQTGRDLVTQDSKKGAGAPQKGAGASNIQRQEMVR